MGRRLDSLLMKDESFRPEDKARMLKRIAEDDEELSIALLCTLVSNVTKVIAEGPWTSWTLIKTFIRSNPSISSLHRHFTNLKYVELIGTFNDDDDITFDALALCAQLPSVEELIGESLMCSSIEKIKHLFSSNVKDLYLYECMLGSPVIEYLIRGMSCLEHFHYRHFSFGDEITPPSSCNIRRVLQKTARNTLKTLTILELDDEMSIDGYIGDLRPFGSLTDLTLDLGMLLDIKGRLPFQVYNIGTQLPVSIRQIRLEQAESRHLVAFLDHLLSLSLLVPNLETVRVSRLGLDCADALEKFEYARKLAAVGIILDLDNIASS